jgi:hypothetical protein
MDRPDPSVGHDVTIAPDAVLEVAPPVVARRGVLIGGGLGVASLVLPSAMAAASVPTVEPTGGAFSYPTGSGVVLHWRAFDTIATPTGVAGTGITDVSGTHGRGGTGSGTNDDPRVAANGKFGDDPAHTSLWGIQSTTNELTLDGASASPHLEWTIQNASASSLTVSTLVLYRLGNRPRVNAEGVLNLAFYVSTSAGFASPVLRRTAAFAHNVTRHLVVTLGDGSGVTLAQNASLTVRAFPYSTPTERQIRLIQYDSTDGNDEGTLKRLTTFDSVRTDVVGLPTGDGNTGNHVSAFIGTFTPLPTP